MKHKYLYITVFVVNVYKRMCVMIIKISFDYEFCLLKESLCLLVTSNKMLFRHTQRFFKLSKKGKLHQKVTESNNLLF